MKKKINISDYAAHIYEALSKGILLNTMDEKFNSMVIGWGHIGKIFSLPSFTVYVRASRYTKAQLDISGEFTVSVPLGEADPQILKICGSKSGYDIDKVKEAALTLEEPELIDIPGIKEFPLTLECKVLHSGKLNSAELPEEIKQRYYPGDPDEHTFYIAQIVAAYIIEK